MVQRIRSFADGLRRQLGIIVKCECGKTCTFRARDFEGYIAPGAEIEELTWRCSWCRKTSTWVRYTLIDVNNREGLTQWMPPAGRKPRWPSGIEELEERGKG